MPTVLASGFGPFPPWTDNPSWDALQLATPSLPPSWQLRRVRLDVAWQRAAPTLLAAIDADVGLVIAFGQADDAAVRVERFAVNACQRDLADVDGARFGADHIVVGGPAAHETRLPWLDLLDALRTRGVPAIESRFAGGYLCNQTFYRLMEALKEQPRVCAGFVHVPPLGRLAFAQTRSAIETVIETCVGYCESTI